MAFQQNYKSQMTWPEFCRMKEREHDTMIEERAKAKDRKDKKEKGEK